MNNTNSRIRIWLAGAAALSLLLLPTDALAGGPRTVLDGRELVFADVSPLIEDGRTLVPMRGFLTALGADIDWEQKSRTAIAIMNGVRIEAPIDSAAARVDGRVVPLAVPPRLIEGRTMVPLRFFAEELGLSVIWDEESQTVFVSSRRGAIASRDGGGVDRDRTAPPPVMPAEPPPVTPVTPPPVAPPAPSAIEQVVAEARGLIGRPYAWGGRSPANGFDCSGFVYYLASLVGVDMPRTSYDQFNAGIRAVELHVGDLVFFTTYQAGPSHVGVYIGEGNFVHAQSEQTGVLVTSMSNPWWSSRYLGARRVFE